MKPNQHHRVISTPKHSRTLEFISVLVFLLKIYPKHTAWRKSQTHFLYCNHNALLISQRLAYLLAVCAASRSMLSHQRVRKRFWLNDSETKCVDIKRMVVILL